MQESPSPRGFLDLYIGLKKCPIFESSLCVKAVYKYLYINKFAQFLAVCIRSKWPKDLTNFPLLALLAMAGFNAAHKISSVCSKTF
jgi:hypothetical protein